MLLMRWVKKGIVGLLALVLLASLVGGALSTSANIALDHPGKIEAWLNQSHFYDAFITNALNEAQKSAGGSVGSVSLSDPAVRQAAEKAYSPQLLQQNVNTILNSNYAWLQGKTATPTFNIDLTGAKQSFANEISTAVEKQKNSMTQCSVDQLNQLLSESQNIQNIDPLSVPCRPAGVSSQAEAAQVEQAISANNSFLSGHTTVTASTLSPSGKSQNQPYYQEFSAAPKFYRWSVTLPWIYALAALLSLIGIVFLAPRKRRGLRIVCVVLLEAGLILLVIKLLGDKALPHVENKIFNGSSVGPLQKSLVDFLHLAEAQLVKIDFWFGIAYLTLAFALVLYLFITRKSAVESTPKPQLKARATTTTPPIPATPSTSTTPTATRPKHQKPPRLIQ